MRIRIGSVFLLLAVAGCAVPNTAPLPPDARPNLSPRWLSATGELRLPEHDGFAGKPFPVLLPPGMLIDRFGSENGTFFSPKGASFDGRALPYGCTARSYTTYEVLRPVLAWTGTAAPWFDEPGGATQFKTDASAAWLVADGTLRSLPRSDSGPAPRRNNPPINDRRYAFSSACLRSARMSSSCSMPIDSRTYPSVTPVCSCSSGVSCECVVEAGWIARLRVSPILAT